MKLYVSGRIKGEPEAERIFKDAAVLLAQAGYEPLNSLDVAAICRPPCNGEGDELHYDCFMRGDLRDMLTCDGLAMLPGWERSRGARLEQSIAVQVGMRVRDLGYWVPA